MKTIRNSLMIGIGLLMVTGFMDGKKVAEPNPDLLVRVASSYSLTEFTKNSTPYTVHSNKGGKISVIR